MRILKMTACCALILGSMVAAAQMGTSAGPAPAVGSIATPAAALDSQLSLIEMEMMGAVKAMPADKFGFAPSAAIFVPTQKTEFATVRTFAGQATHVAEANMYFAALFSGQQPDPKMRDVEKLTNKDDIVAALANSFAAAHKAMATLTPANAFEVIKSPEPGFATRATLAGFLISHANDHYGQMVEYLRMNGLVPPASAR
jgi:uncharacterized damage-inducible protein DinB